MTIEQTAGTVSRVLGIGWVLPAIRIALVLIATVSLYAVYNRWSNSLIEEGVMQQRAAQGAVDQKRIEAVILRLEAIGTSSVDGADSAANQDRAVARKLDQILATFKEMPLAKAGADGVCRPTAEAIRNWNSLQDTVKQSETTGSKIIGWSELMSTKLR